MRFKEAFRQAAIDILVKQELKALKRTPGDSQWVSMKVTGTRDLIKFSNRGWKIASTVPLGRGAGFTQYILWIDRSELQASHEKAK